VSDGGWYFPFLVQFFVFGFVEEPVQKRDEMEKSWEENRIEMRDILRGGDATTQITCV
jgi:hypothetical protein